jgi:3-mercaptopyruvate sulfurtransferase SseA
MTRKFFIPAALALAASAALLGACKAADTAGTPGAASASSQAGAQAASKSAPPTTTTVVHADGARRVGPAELQKMVEGGRVVIYDTRSKANYDQEHIKGALSMPSEEVEGRAGEFPRDKTLVFYCT